MSSKKVKNMQKKTIPISGLLILLPVVFLTTCTAQKPQATQKVQQYPSYQPCTTNVTFLDDVYLKTSGSTFTYSGQKVCLYGATIYTSQGTDVPNYNWMSTNFPQRIDWDLNLAQQANVNSIRPTDQTNAANDDPYNPVVWANMDYLIQQARAKGVFVELDLSTFANHLKSQNINPFDPALEPQWQQYITFVVSRYKNTPNISNYSLMGEVNQVHSNLFPKSTTQGYLDFYTRLVNDVYAADQGNHLITAGGFSHLNEPDSGIPWQQIYSLPHVDFAAIHVYPANSLDPIHTSEDLHITIPMVGKWAQQNHKPAEIEEYGFQQIIGDQNRANDMATIEQAANTNGFAGLILWNLGPEAIGGAHYDINPHWPLAWQQFVTGAAQFGKTQ